MKNKILITGFLIVLLGVFAGCLGMSEMEVEEEQEQEVEAVVKPVEAKPSMDAVKFAEEQE